MSNQCIHAVPFHWHNETEMEFITQFRYGCLPRWSDHHTLLCNTNPIILDSKALLSKDQQEYAYQSHQGSMSLLMTTQLKAISWDCVYTYCPIHKCLLRVKCNPQTRCFSFQPREMMDHV
jgi:hypothetical protein